MSQPLIKKLSNNLPVLLVPMPGTAAATILVIARIGSRYEKKNEQGMSHMLEHMLFKGSQNWPTAKDIAQTLDGIGADYNAFTSKDHTGYYIKAAAEHLPLATKVVADMIWRPVLDKDELEREKKVICEEIKMYEDNPLMHISDLLEGLIFAGSSLGVSIAGSIKSVSALRRRQVYDYHRRYYWPGNLLVAVAGKLPATTAKLLNLEFGQKVSGHRGLFRYFQVKQFRPRVVIQTKETQQVQLALGFPAYGYKHKLRLALDLLALILGGNMSSRLFLRLREREGLCYSISAAAENYDEVGLFSVQAGLDTSRLPQAIRLIKEELNKVVTEPVTTAELIKAKEYIKGKMTLAMENSSFRAQWAARQYLFENRRESLKQFLARISQLTKADLLKAAAEVVDFHRANLALIGPFTNRRRWLKLIEP